MPIINIETRIHGNYLSVMERFDLDLFKYLLPSYPKVEIIAFTGSETGDHVHLKFHKPFNTEWISKIIDHGQTTEMAYFTDKGEKLPSILKSWTHKHIVRRVSENESLIVDEIHYKSLNTILSLLIYPILYLSFYGRKRQYKNYFKKVI